MQDAFRGTRQMPQDLNTQARKIIDRFKQASSESDASERWEKYLIEQCAGNHELIAAIKSSLESQILVPGQNEKSASPHSKLEQLLEVVETLYGRFQTREWLGIGGQGVVLKALDPDLQRVVALKVLHPQWRGRPDIVARFKREAEIIGKLEHPNIVPIYETGRASSDESPYYAMRVFPGGSLSKAIEDYHRSVNVTGNEAARSVRSGKSELRNADQVEIRPQDCVDLKLDLRDLLRRYLSACEAVAYAHSKGVVHRDLKPANVVLGQFGETLVVDWGLAKILGDIEPSPLPPDPPQFPPASNGSLVTLQGAMLGTPGYRSPEQAQGRTDEIGPASDIYSLGAILYCILTGTNPPENRPDTIPSSASRALNAICLKAMALKPKDRYTSILGLANDIQNWLNDEPVSAWSEPSAVKFRRFVKRHPRIIASTAAAVLVSVLGLAILNMVIGAKNVELKIAKDDADKRTVDANRAKGKEQKAKEEAEASKKELALELSAATMRSAELALLRGDAKEAWDLLNRVPKEHRELSWRLLKNSLTADMTLLGHGYSVNCVRFSPDGALIASAAGDDLRGQGEAKLWDAETGQEIRTLFHGGPVRSIEFSRDGQRLVTACADSIVRIWETKSGELLTELKGHGQEVYEACFSPDGQLVASGGQDQSIRVWETRSGKLLATLPHELPVICVAFEPQGRFLVAVESDDLVKREADLAAVAEADPESRAVSVVGGILNPRRSKIRVWKMGWTLFTGTKFEASPSLSTDPQAQISCLSFHPFDNSLAFANQNGVIKRAVFQQPKNGQALAFTVLMDDLYFPSGIRSLTHSPDGNWLMATTFKGVVKLVDLRDRAQSRSLVGHVSSSTSASFSPDARRVVSAATDGTLRVWSDRGTTDCGFRPRSLLLPNENPGLSLNGLALSPDGKHLIAAYSNPELDGVSLPSRSQQDSAKPPIPGRLQLWNTDVWQLVSQFHSAPAQYTHVTFDPTGEYIAAVHQRQDARIALPSKINELMQGAMTGEITPDELVRRMKKLQAAVPQLIVRDLSEAASIVDRQVHSSLISSLDWTIAKGPILTTAWDGTITFTDPRNGVPASHNEQPLPITDGCFSSSGRWFGTASYTIGTQSNIHIFDTTNRTLRHSIFGHKGQHVNCIAFSPDEKLVATGGWDGNVCLWSIDTGEITQTLRGDGAAVESVCFTSDGLYLIATTGRLLTFWSVARGTRTIVIEAETELVKVLGTNLVVDPQNRFLAAIQGNQICVWNEFDPRRMRILEDRTRFVNDGCFSPDGRRFASCSQDETIKVWNLEDDSRSPPMTIRGHTGPVYTLSFSPDGRRIASGSRDNTIRVWDAATGHQLFAVSGENRFVKVRYSQDGQTIFSRQRNNKSGKTLTQAWNAESGAEMKLPDEVPSLDDDRRRSPTRDNPWIAARFATQFFVYEATDPSAEELAFRKQKFLPDLQWHHDEAEKSETAKASSSAAFHLAWELKLSPDSKGIRDRLVRTVESLRKAQHRIPEIATQTLKATSPVAE